MCYSHKGPGKHLLSDSKSCYLWGPEQDKALQKVQAAVQAALSTGPYDLADIMVLEVSVTDRDAAWSL